MLDAKGQPLNGGAATNPLKIGRILHGCDNEGVCAPLIVQAVSGSTITGAIFAGALVSMEMRHDPQPDVTTRIKTPTPRPPTWHWPAECPWNR
jgi:hypothetical protein